MDDKIVKFSPKSYLHNLCPSLGVTHCTWKTHPAYWFLIMVNIYYILEGMTGDMAWSGHEWYSVHLSLLGLVLSEDICMLYVNLFSA
jgi:hypothetical protein